MPLSSSTALLVAGNGLAVPFTVYVPGFYRLWRKREPWVFATEETGAVLIAVAYGLKGKPLLAGFNASWAAGLAIAYALEGRKRAGRAKAERSAAQAR